MPELTEARRIALFKEGDGLLRGTLAYKSGCSLAEDDHRPDNQQAIDLYYETRARLWETLGHLDTHELTHFKAYVRRCAANAWVDHLRERHPMRLSLRNRLLYFVKTHPERFAIDRDVQSGRVDHDVGSDRGTVVVGHGVRSAVEEPI